jgi:hypothetical protein
MGYTLAYEYTSTIMMMQISSRVAAFLMNSCPGASPLSVMPFYLYLDLRQVQKATRHAYHIPRRALADA